MIKYLKLLAFVILFITTSAYPKVNLNKHPIYTQIIKNKPSIDKQYAMKLSNIIYRMHKKYHIPSRIFTAILMQESGYLLSAKGCHGGYRFETETELELRCSEQSSSSMVNYSQCKVEGPIAVESRVCTDFGISQIYYKTANRFGFNVFKLTSDLEYSVEAGAIVLSNFMKKYEARESDWFVRYNCGTRGTTGRDTCLIYKKLLERYM